MSCVCGGGKATQRAQHLQWHGPTWSGFRVTTLPTWNKCSFLTCKTLRACCTIAESWPLIPNSVFQLFLGNNQTFVHIPMELRNPRMGITNEQGGGMVIGSNRLDQSWRVINFSFFSSPRPRLMIDCSFKDRPHHQSQSQGFAQDNCEWWRSKIVKERNMRTHTHGRG